MNMQNTDCVREAVEEYGDMLYRICLVMLRNTADAEDAVQDTFIRFMQKAPVFQGEEHEKAWLIKVASNVCKDMLRQRDKVTELDEATMNTIADSEDDTHILEALMQIPEKFRIVLTLHYIEGYKVDEIAQIIKKTSSAVKMRLSKGRKLLEDKYRKEYM
jgi:RNA polymerase sigma-70 factor (ECF subfamily)